MPPVLGPLSPSSRALWSWLVASGSTLLPSTMTMKLASSPTQELLDHHAVAGLAEGIAREHVVHRGDRPASSVVGEDHALAGRQAVGLDHDRARPARGCRPRAGAISVKVR